MRKPSTRQEKIKLLMDLQIGKISINDLKPINYRTWFQDKQNPEQFICQETQSKATRSLIESFDPPGQKTMNIVVDYSRISQTENNLN